MQTMYPGIVNSPVTELSAAITAAATTITLLNGAALPAAPNLAVIGSGELAETVLYTAKSGNTISGITRGWQGTARAWPQGTGVARNFTEYDYAAMLANINELDATKAGTAAATTSASGLMTAAMLTKLNGIAAGAQVNPGVATISVDGLMSSADKAKLNSIQNAAQVNRTQATQAQAIAGMDSATSMSPLRVREAIDARTRYGTTAGTATAFTLTLSPAPASLYTGIEVKVKLHTNTGTNPTLNVNSLGAKALYDGDGARFSGESGKIYSFIYDGSNFIQSSGGGGAKLNVYTGTTQPSKKEGVWIQTSQAITDIRNDLDYWVANAWSGMSYAEPPTPFASREAASASVGQYIYYMGGITSNDRNYRYDTINNSWSVMAPMPENRYGHKAVSVGIYIYVTGGAASTGSAVRSTWRYNTSTNTWTTLSDMPAYRYQHALVAVGNFIYMLGGSSNTSNNPTTSCYRYDIANDTWTGDNSIFANMPIGVYMHTAASVGNYIYLIGTSLVTHSYRYDISNNTWSTSLSMANPPSVNTYRTLVSVGQYLYYLGQPGTPSSTKFHFRYDTVSDTWTELENPSEYTVYAHIAEHVDGVIYYIGGTRNPSTTATVTAYALSSKSYASGTFLLVRHNPNNGVYSTELLSPSTSLLGVNTRILSHFDDVLIQIGSSLRDDLPSYYGDGSSWIKFKN